MPRRKDWELWIREAIEKNSYRETYLQPGDIFCWSVPVWAIRVEVDAAYEECHLVTTNFLLPSEYVDAEGRLLDRGNWSTIPNGLQIGVREGVIQLDDVL